MNYRELADDSWADMPTELQFAERSFMKFNRFAGFAIHSWESYRSKPRR